MNIAKSLNAKISLLVAMISIVVFACILVYNAASESALLRGTIRDASEEIAGLIFLSVEKPMVIGDNPATAKEFADIKAKYPKITAYMTSYTGNVTYSTEPGAVRKDLSAVLTSKELAGASAQALKASQQTSLFVEEGGKRQSARVISVPNASRCHHCHGASEPILGQMTLLVDVSEELSEVDAQTRNSLLVGVAGLIVLMATCILAIRGLFLKRLARITSDAEKVARGDFSATFHMPGQDEMHTLATDLAAMVGQLKNRLGFSQGVLNGIPVPCAIVGPDHRMLWINAQMCALLQKPDAPESYVGQTSGGFFWGDATRETLSDKAIKLRKPQQGQRDWAMPNGETLHVNITTTPFYDMDGEILGSITFWIDVTELRQQQERIASQHEKLAHAAGKADQIAGQLKHASGQLSERITDASGGSRMQRGRIQETAAAVEEMNASILEVARNASDAAVNADNARQRALSGQQVTTDSINAIMSVRQQTEHMRQSLNALGEQVRGIGHVIDIINDIADQTNLLALNAAIEAARAGEHGRGFAVVADEVRKLAEKTMAATKEVNTAIVGIQGGAKTNIDLMEAAGREVEQGAEMVKRAGEALKSIVDVSVNTADMVRSIATAAEEQSAASEEIARSIDDVNRIAGENDAIMQELSQATSDVAEMASSIEVVTKEMTD